MVKTLSRLVISNTLCTSGLARRGAGCPAFLDHLIDAEQFRQHGARQVVHMHKIQHEVNARPVFTNSRTSFPNCVTFTHRYAQAPMRPTVILPIVSKVTSGVSFMILRLPAQAFSPHAHFQQWSSGLYVTLSMQ